MKLAVGLLAIFITLPLWFWLLYQILVRVDATELMWFLYWVYVPVTIFVASVSKAIESNK